MDQQDHSYIVSGVKDRCPSNSKVGGEGKGAAGDIRTKCVEMILGWGTRDISLGIWVEHKGY